MKKTAFLIIVVITVLLYKLTPSLESRIYSAGLMASSNSNVIDTNVNEGAVFFESIDDDIVSPKNESVDIGGDFGISYISIGEEFKSGDYSRVSEYFNIVNLCNAVPKNDAELQANLLKHNGDEGFDVEFLSSQMELCATVPFISYEAQASTYRMGIKYGNDDSILYLALLMPQESDEKKRLLETSSVFSEIAVKMLAENSLNDSSQYSDISRLFWLTIFPQIKSLYPDKADLTTMNITAYMDNDIITTVQNFSTKWSSAERTEKREILEELKKLEISSKI
ncbi:hypothetical protein [Shewanella colwelliana]|uniref:hypothetical protein n=1 Tax=Shewanella colwelliana TaxID=23 RepID=UPI003736F1DF